MGRRRRNIGDRSRFGIRACFLAWFSQSPAITTGDHRQHFLRRRHHYAHSPPPPSRCSFQVSSPSSRLLRLYASVPAGPIDGPTVTTASSSAGTSLWVYFAIAAAAVVFTLLVQYVLHLISSSRHHSDVAVA